MRAPQSLIAAAILAALALVNVYRACTQAITYDEAAAYLIFLPGPFTRVFTQYGANNHVLYSVLASIAVALFGVSEATLRLPSIAAGTIFLAMVFLTCRALFGRGTVFLTAVAAVALNPYVLDFLSAARGYGMALAALTVALYQLIRALGEGSGAPWRWFAASIALGCCVCANLAFTFPALALAVAALGLSAWADDHQISRARRIAGAALWLAVPGSLFATALLIVPLMHAKRSQFYFGAPQFNDTVVSLVDGSLRHPISPWMLWSGMAACAIVIALVNGRLIARLISAQQLSVLTPIERFVVLDSVALTLTVLLLVVAHYGLGLNYPYERTGLYFLPLVTLLTSSVGQTLLVARATARVMGRTMVAALVLVTARFVTEFTVSYYYEWRFDAGSRAIFDAIARWPGRHADMPWRVAAADVYEPALTFYRVTRGESAIAPIRDDWSPGDWNYDFFVVTPGPDLERTRAFARPVYVDPVSGVVLLKRDY